MNTPVGPFKDTTGRWRTKSLFKDFHSPNQEQWPPVFTLKEHDDGEYKSLRQIYLSFDDPTGYAFAKAVLKSWEHWKKLCSLEWFKAHLDSWNEELEVKLAAKGIKKAREIADGDSGQAFQASKFLVDRGWEKSGRGRPKKEREANERIRARIEASIEEDEQRLRLVS